ncbi:alpha/beta hydrolase family protein [Arthrobacter sp. MA-N2]|uniref:alpha/beta hydrolase family protein n=1 Tax=Arthrobacter sp. MA-N2 TaxID=1101188 RepID=UPI000487342E|nr:hypothetical protein [Arthrobacter sp. MA-N2]
MAIESLFDEDHLIPIALLENTLFVFSSLDGCLYRLSHQTPRQVGEYEPVCLAEIESPFCVPGHPYIYDLVHTASLVTVREYPLTATGMASPRCRAYEAPPKETHQLTSLIPDAAAATLRIVFEPTAPNSPCLFTDVQSGITQPLETVRGTPRCVLSDGTVVSDSDGRWSIGSDANPQGHGDGTVIATASHFVIVRMSDKSGIWFSMVRTAGESDIEPPCGWTIVSLAASDKTVIAYAIHPKKGQRLLKAEPDNLTFSLMDSPCGTSQVFGMGAAFEPVVRSTGLLIGSLWQTQRTRLPGIAFAKNNLSLEYITPAEVPCVYVRRKESRANEIIVSLHGGPDSHELDDLRYGGIYWDALDAGFDVLITNYPGSAGFGAEYQEHAWKNWDAAVLQTADAINEFAAAKGVSGISIFGVSFGAWMGLQLSRHVKTRRLVAMSPLLNLTQHIQLHQDEDHNFRSWAEERFTQLGEKSLNGERYALACPVPVVILAPERDEIVLPASTQNSVLAATSACRQWTTITVPGNHYPHTSAEAAQRWTVLSNALTTNEC